MDLFVIDTCPNQDLFEENQENSEVQEPVSFPIESDDEDEDYGG